MPPIYIGEVQVQKRYIGITQAVSVFLDGYPLLGYPLLGFDPKSLFTNGEQGAWYDPSDLSTMFQDSAGTTPVTANGQPVGLILDKSKGLVLGPESVTNGDFSNGLTGWTATNWTVVDGKATTNTTSSSDRLTQNSVIPANSFVEVSFDLVVVSGGLSLVSSTAFAVAVVFTTSGRKTCYGRNTSATADMISFLRNAVAGSFNGSIDNISVRELPGNHASQATAAKRPLLQNDGVNNYLAFDGVDDALATASIDFTSTDKMSMFSGYRVLVNNACVLYEHSAKWNTNPKAFAQFAPIQADGRQDAGFYTGTGHNYRTSSAPLAVPNSYVSILQCDIAGGNTAALQVPLFKLNGVATTAAVGPGNATGTFGNYPLFIGARAGASTFFSGRIYSLILLGRLATTQEITDTETWVADKTGVTLP